MLYMKCFLYYSFSLNLDFMNCFMHCKCKNKNGYDEAFTYVRLGQACMPAPSSVKSCLPNHLIIKLFNWIRNHMDWNRNFWFLPVFFVDFFQISSSKLQHPPMSAVQLLISSLLSSPATVFDPSLIYFSVKLVTTLLL